MLSGINSVVGSLRAVSVQTLYINNIKESFSKNYRQAEREILLPPCSPLNTCDSNKRSSMKMILAAKFEATLRSCTNICATYLLVLKGSAERPCDTLHGSKSHFEEPVQAGGGHRYRFPWVGDATFVLLLCLPLCYCASTTCLQGKTRTL